MRRQKKEKGKGQAVLLEEWLNRLAERERTAGRVHTASNYGSALRSVQKYLGADARGFPLAEVEPDWVEGYAAYLKTRHSLKAGSANCYFRNLRAVYNKAVKEGIIPPPGTSPFRGVSIPVPPTAKRTLSVEDMRKIVEAGLSAVRHEKQAGPCAGHLFIPLLCAWHVLCRRVQPPERERAWRLYRLQPQQNGGGPAG